mmetsp:Transcript_81368/g.226606  ORF Transcript_81368/g.226606 Transcript_81368/m.226606 type:complete len:105 (-) Transcript_81368:204-518(-)
MPAHAPAAPSTSASAEGLHGQAPEGAFAASAWQGRTVSIDATVEAPGRIVPAPMPLERPTAMWGLATDLIGAAPADPWHSGDDPWAASLGKVVQQRSQRGACRI